MRPEFITFTGADDWTDVKRMVELGRRYPIEWGILFSPKRQGIDPRYPGAEAQSRLWWADIRRAAHLCGEHSRRIMAGQVIDTPVDLSFAERVQINHVDPKPVRAHDFAIGWGIGRAVVQCRGTAFPTYNDTVQWLFDNSGGRAMVPEVWPRHPGGGRMVGYAGGISPDNIAGVMRLLSEIEGRYWIDMESGVRTEDRFDLDKVEAVCRAVYGPSGA